MGKTNNKPQNIKSNSFTNNFKTFKNHTGVVFHLSKFLIKSELFFFKF